MKEGKKTTEFLAMIAALIVAIVPVMMDKVPEDSVWAVMLGGLLAVATYIAGRSVVKAKAETAKKP